MAQHIRDLGSFESIQQVWTALPGGGMEGDYLTINGNQFAWNKFIRQWQNDTTVINNPARETQTHDGDMNIGNDARIGGNLVVIGNIINDSIKNGLSAFELAVKGGFGGSEEDWLNSLIGKSAYQIWLEQAGNAGKNMTQFLAWMKDTQAIRGPKYIEDESLIDTVNDRMTLFYVPSGTSYKVVFVDEGGGTHTLANRIGDITNYAGIYDVSADNEDNGVIPSYGTLSDAIDDIAETAKKGGMTIKYLGTDNKYYQYRLLASTFTDDINYWEDENRDYFSAEDINLDNLFKVRTVLSSEDKFISNENIFINNYGCKFMPVKYGEEYDIIPDKDAVLAVLTRIGTHYYADLLDASYAYGYSRVNVQANKVYHVVVPNDARYIYLNVKGSVGDISYSIRRYKRWDDGSRVDAISTEYREIALERTHHSFMYAMTTLEHKNTYGSYSFKLGGQKTIRVTNESDARIMYTFLAQKPSATDNVPPNFAKSSIFTNLPVGDSAILNVPEDATYLYIADNGSETHDYYPKIEELVASLDYVPATIEEHVDAVLSPIEERVKAVPLIIDDIEVICNGSSAIRKKVFNGNAKKGIYKLTLSNGYSVSDIQGAQSGIILLSVNLRDAASESLATIYAIRKYDNNPLSRVDNPGQIIVCIDDDEVKDLTISINGNSGEVVGIIVEEIPMSSYVNLLHDVAFEDEDDTKRSFRFKLNKGEIVRYEVSATDGDAFLKAYSRNRTDNEEEFKVKELTATESGIQAGVFYYHDDCFVELTSALGSNPTCKVYDYHNEYPSLEYPYQLKFDTDNMTTILSPDDNEASIYDNDRCVGGRILQISDTMYYMLYHARGEYSDNIRVSQDGDFSENVLFNVCLAYLDTSVQNSQWVRGIPSGIESPHIDTNVLILNTDINGIFSDTVVNKNSNDTGTITQHINGFDVCKVDNDIEYPYRMFAEVRKIVRRTNPNTNQIEVVASMQGGRHYLFKSPDAIHWIRVRKVLDAIHDCYPNIIYKDGLINVYLRMWDYSQAEETNKRLIGVLTIDIHGNVVVPPSGLFGKGLYQPSATYIGNGRVLMIPSHFYSSDSVHGDSALEAYIIENGKVYDVPTYGINGMTNVVDGWRIVRSLVSIDNTLYCLYSQFTKKHGESGSEVSLKLCPVSYVTKNEGNHGVGGGTTNEG